MAPPSMRDPRQADGYRRVAADSAGSGVDVCYIDSTAGRSLPQPTDPAGAEFRRTSGHSPEKMAASVLGPRRAIAFVRCDGTGKPEVRWSAMDASLRRSWRPSWPPRLAATAASMGAWAPCRVPPAWGAADWPKPERPPLVAEAAVEAAEAEAWVAVVAASSRRAPT